MGALNENAITRIATVTGVDATATGSTLLYTTPVGKTFIPLLFIPRCTSFTVGSKATDVVMTFGTNSSDYDNLIGSSTIDINASDDFEIIEVAKDTNKLAVSAGTGVYVDVDTASDATTETLAIDVFGYLF